MKLWIDDIRQAPEGYLPFRTVNDALRYIRWNSDFIDIIDLDQLVLNAKQALDAVLTQAEEDAAKRMAVFKAVGELIK